MIHYLLIRRDLPFGVTLAQLAHAAADSMEAWIKANTFIHQGHGWDSDSIDYPPHEPITVVVLGTRNVLTLKNFARRLKTRKIPFHSVREPDAPWNGQLMAIGVWPGERVKLEPVFKNLQTFRFEDWTGWVPTRLEDVR